MALKNWGVASHKKITLFLWKDVKTSLVLLALRFIPLKDEFFRNAKYVLFSAQLLYGIERGYYCLTPKRLPQ